MTCRSDYLQVAWQVKYQVLASFWYSWYALSLEDYGDQLGERSHIRRLFMWTIQDRVNSSGPSDLHSC